MKVFFNYLAVTVALALGFSSCSSDEDLAGNGGNPIPTGKATTFTLSIAQPKTYATDPNATDAERLMKSVQVFIFSDAGVYEKTELLTAADFTQSPDNEYTSAKQISTTVGPKKVYVGVNLPEAVANKVASVGISEIYKVVTASDLMETANGFAMFSKVASDAAFVEDADPTSGTANKVSATVARLLAKVSVQGGTNYVTTGGKVSNLNFSLSNISKLYYILPNVSLLSPELLLSQLYKENNYKAINAVNEPLASTKVSYVLENAANVALQGFATYASISATFIPTDVVKLSVAGDGSSDLVAETAPVTAQDFYTVANSAGALKFFLDADDAGAYNTHINGANSRLNFYQGGQCYYKAYLNDADNYKIYRNNFYKVNVTKINRIGDPTDTVPTPDAPIAKPTNITVDIEVESWIENIQNSELG